MLLNQRHDVHFLLRVFYVLLLCFFTCFFRPALAAAESPQQYALPDVFKHKDLTASEKTKLLDSPQLKVQLQQLARQVFAELDKGKSAQRIAVLTLLGKHQASLDEISTSKRPLSLFHFEAINRAALSQSTTHKESGDDAQLHEWVKQAVTSSDDEALYHISHTLDWSTERGREYLLFLLSRYQKQQHLTVNDALNLLYNFSLLFSYEKVLAASEGLIKQEKARRYIIEPDIVIKTSEGVSLSAVVVRKRHQLSASEPVRLPTAFQFSIYADEAWHIKTAIHAAAHGYVGVVANTRGKRLSTDEIVPWEHDGKDGAEVIRWIRQQAWSDGRVAMYGGSYLGFTQWAIAKHMPEGLETIVPYTAANPVTGLPMENNIFLTGNYQWSFFVTNNKTMDNSVYADHQHWQEVNKTLFESGRAFADIDKIEGTPNPWFQKWLAHPEFDDYYQAMLPFQQDYKRINIPVLSITGYFDGGQISATDFLQRHYKYNSNANHTLLIGPYTHRSAQGIPGPRVGQYELDEVALEKDTEELTFAWFDYVLHGAARPRLVKDKVNYQLMGSNTWQHSPSFESLNQQGIDFYPGNNLSHDGTYQLTNTAEPGGYVTQHIDLSDRSTEFNKDPWAIIQTDVKDEGGLTFMTEAFSQPYQFAGRVTGEFQLAINKQDFDIGFNLYELTADGEYFHLMNYRSRASYADDMSKRKLLQPGVKTRIPVTNSRMSAKVIAKGSRLVLVLGVNKNHDAQVNMGTGRDVSTETVADAKEPLIIKWFSDTRLHFPLTAWE